MPHDSMAQAEPSVALVVECDDAVRHLASAVLEETDLSVISCRSAEAALSVLERDDVSVAMLFADADLAGGMAGGMDGVALARTVEARWPSVRLVVTSDHGRDSALPKQAVHMAKPWRALDVLVQAEHATLEARAA